MRLLIITAGFPPAYLGGGPIRTVSAMLRSAPQHHEAYVLTANHDLGQADRLVEDASAWHSVGKSMVRYVDRGVGSWLRALRAGLKTDPAAVYLNSLFSPKYSLSVLPFVAVNPGVRLVIAPRGELSAGALKLKRRKKTLFLAGLRRSGLLRSVIWHASTPLEADDIRQVFGTSARVIVRENDTELPRTSDLPPPCPHQANDRPLEAVFMSRLSPKKGLHVLMEALRDVREDVHLTVVGPEEDRNYTAYCRDLATKASPSVTVDFVGPVTPDKMRETLSRFDVMVFPTAGENFGHVVAEALSVGCPVVISDTTPWSSLVREHRAGGVVKDLAPSSWARMLDAVVTQGPVQWRATRERTARAYDVWRAQDDAPHFFDLLETEMARKTSREIG